MCAAVRLASRAFPSRVAELGFSAELPADWISHDLPTDDVDFSTPTVMMPLAVVTAPHAALVFAFAARPAFDDGTLHDWTMYLLANNGLQPRAVGRAVVAGVGAIVGEAAQDSEMGPMVVRFAFLEDGGRLINLTLSAPEMLEETVREAWFALLRSFRLETPRGSRFPVEAQDEVAPAAPPDASIAGAESEATSESPADPQPASKARLADFALADDTTSLDPETSINANLRDRGIGLVPRIVAVDEADRRATVAAGAIASFIDVPFGWHVIDDGRRTLVFEPTGRVQVNLDLVARDGRADDEILDAIEARMREDYPAPEFVRVASESIRALGARNIADGNQPIEQYHLLHAHHSETSVLRARVTTAPGEATGGANLAELILDSCRVAVAPEATREESTDDTADPDQPTWWTTALALDAQDRFDEAERVIREGCPHIGFARATAEMYRLRMRRLRAAGDEEGALDAFRRSSGSIAFYASLATSGGEGVALSAERDEFHAELVAEFGRDPEAQRA